MIAGLVSFLASSPMTIGLFSTASSVGRSVGPFLITPWVDRSASKKRCLLWLWAGVVLSWGAAAAYLWTPLAADRGRTLGWFFLCYSAFFTFLGCAAVAQGSLLGKIIPADRRGHALSAAHSISGPVNLCALLAVYSLVRSGAFPTPRNYAFSFTITTVLFLLSGVAVARAREVPSASPRDKGGLRLRLVHARNLIRDNRDFRLLLGIQLALGTGGAALAFYTAYGRATGSIQDANVVLATLLQVGCQSAAAATLGRLADRRGNRAVIRVLLWLEAFTPVSAVLAASLFPGTGAFLVVYCLVGARFPVYDLLVNYLLEIVPEADHAMALGAVNTLLVVTVGSPVLLGFLAARAGYAVAMLAAAVVLASAAITALFLAEPRQRFGAPRTAREP